MINQFIDLFLLCCDYLSLLLIYHKTVGFKINIFLLFSFVKKKGD